VNFHSRRPLNTDPSSFIRTSTKLGDDASGLEDTAGDLLASALVPSLMLGAAATFAIASATEDPRATLAASAAGAGVLL
jgi:hypothetical protein